MRFHLRIWRQPDAQSAGQMANFTLDGVTPDMSFLEMLDLLNEQLITAGEEPVAFDHDCREGICGACSLMINGQAHGPQALTTTCQLYMRHFEDGSTIIIEPWRSAAFPVIRDLIVDRSALDRIIQSGGYISNHSGPKPDPNANPIEPAVAELSLDAAACIGCGACVAACPNGAAMLFTAAKVAHLGLLPQGQPERLQRVRSMVARMDEEGFGSCRNYGECEAQCPKGISIAFISLMNRDFAQSQIRRTRHARGPMTSQ